MEFPPCLVINLPDRTDRWNHIQTKFAEWPMHLERVDGIKHEKGFKGCTLSHRKCIELAKQRGYLWFLLLEDDADPVEGGLDQYKALLPILWASRGSWDLFNGGLSTVHDATLLQIHPPIFRVNGWASQFCLIHASAYDKLIEVIGDDPPEGVDNLYSKRHIVQLCTVPHITIQAPGKSNVLSTHTDYLESFKIANAKLMNVLREKDSHLQLPYTASTALVALLFFGAVLLRRK